MSPQLAVGVDLVNISSMQHMLETGGSSFWELCFTARELTHCEGSAARLAARWAAKEATMKALGQGIGEVDPTDIEVTGHEGGRPTLLLHGSARALADEQQVDLALSMSHEDDYAIAFVVATPQLNNTPCQCYSEEENDGTN